MNDRFSVRPVRSYQGPQFPSASALDEPEELAQEARGSARQLAAILMTALTLVFLNGCYRQAPPPIEATQQTPVIVTVPPGPQPVIVTQPQQQIIYVAPPPACQTGERRCRDGATLETCREGGWVPTSCDQYCRDFHGSNAYSEGCLDAAPEPCRCVVEDPYDMIDGGLGFIEPAMMM